MKKTFIRVVCHNNIMEAILDRGVTNVLNLEFINELTEIVHRVRSDSNIRGLVLGSVNDKFFSMGFDIPQLFELSRSDFKVFYRAFNRACIELYTLPKATIAAITGHAVAGGCIIALCCDYRYIAEGKKKMGLNEIKLGVPVPYPVDCILRQIVGFRNACEILDTGEFYLPPELLQMGMVDRVLPLDQVRQKATEKVRLLSTFSTRAFSMIKQNRTEQVEAQIQEKLEEKEEYFIDCWYADETRERLKEAMKKF